MQRLARRTIDGMNGNLPESAETQSSSSTSQLPSNSDLEAEPEAAFCDPWPVSVDIESAAADTLAQINANSSVRVEEDTDSFWSRSVPKPFTATAGSEHSSPILEDRLQCLQMECSSSVSEETQQPSNQESELACLHGVQNRYQDAPQLDDMPLPIQETSPGQSFLFV